MKIIKEKCTKFYYFGEVYYHYEDLSGNFIRESNGFYSDKNERLNSNSRIIEIWYNLQIKNKRVPFFKSISDMDNFIHKFNLTAMKTIKQYVLTQPAMCINGWIEQIKKDGHEKNERIILSCADYFGKIELNTNDLTVNETFIKTIQL